jgi:hypothetical protein
MTNAPTPSHATASPKWLTLYLPIFIALYPLILAVPGLNWEAHVYREFGLIENITSVSRWLVFGQHEWLAPARLAFPACRRCFCLPRRRDQLGTTLFSVDDPG